MKRQAGRLLDGDSPCNYSSTKAKGQLEVPRITPRLQDG